MNFIRYILIVLFSMSFILAQPSATKTSVPFPKKSEAYPIDTHPNLLKMQKEFAEFVKQNSVLNKKLQLTRTTSWGFTVGSTKTWWATNLVDNSFYEVSSTCRAVGTNCYIFVEDSLWGTKVDQDAVNGVLNAFDNSTPADINKGIYETVTDVYGDAPDVDSDPKIIILILNIQDGFDPDLGGGYVAGYFYSVNEYPQSALPSNYKSNESEIFYMDCNPADLLSTNGLNQVMGTTSHEFQHMVHWNYHGNPDVNVNSQETFFNEGCSEISSYICGYGLRSHSGFISNPNTNRSLTEWSDDNTEVLIDYERASRYFLYLYEQFGTEFLGKFVQDANAGKTGINSALSNLSTPTARRYDDIFIDWSIANGLNDKSVDSKWGYDAVNLSLAEGYVQYSSNVSTTTLNVESFASQYITYKSGSNLQFTAVTDNSYPVFKALKIGEGNSEVVDILSGETFQEPGLGTTYNEIKIIAINNYDQSNDFSYSSTGDTASVIEISYDDPYEENYYLALAKGERQAVAFEGVEGAVLHSIQVLLRNTDPINGNIYEYDDTDITGTPLTSQFILSAPSDETWVEKDFTGENIDISSDFIVVFDVPQDVSSGGNTVIVTKKPGTDFYYSLFYQSAEERWVYYTDAGQENVYLNRIRAYYTTNITGVEEITEATPKEFYLEQNYPNPFNPSTTIQFSLPSQQKVELKVYDLLGREVALLVNEVLSAGYYNVNFNASNLASGAYVYRITTNDFIQSKKMLLVK